MYDNVVVVGICSRTFFYEKAGVRILRMISDMLKLPLSTIRPLFITRIRSATLEIAPKSWVMKIS